MTSPSWQMTRPVGSPDGFKTQQEYDNAWKGLADLSKRMYGEDSSQRTLNQGQSQFGTQTQAGPQGTSAPPSPGGMNMSAWNAPQQPAPRPSNTSYADAWNNAMAQRGDGVRYTPATSVIGQGQGNLAYMPSDRRPAPFTMQAYDLQGRPTSLQGQQQQRDAFISQLVSAPSNTPQYDFRGMMGRADDMVKDGWTNPFATSGDRATIQDLFTRNNIQAPPGFMDQLLGVLGQQAPPPQMPLAPPAGAWNEPDPRFMGPAMLPQQAPPQQFSGPVPPAAVGGSPDLYQRQTPVGEMTPEARRSRMGEEVRIANLQEQARAATPGGGPGGSGTLLAPQQPAQWQPGQAQPIQPQSQGTPYTPPAEPQSLEQKKRELYAKIKAPGAIPWPTTKEEMATYEQRKQDQEDEVWEAKRQYAALNGQPFSEPKPSVARAEKAAREKADGEERAKIREIERVNKNTDWFTRDILGTLGPGYANDYKMGRIDDIEGAVDRAIAGLPPDQRAVAEQWRELSYSNASDDQWRGAMKKFRSLQQQSRALAAPPPAAPAPSRAAPVRQPWRARR